MSSLTTYLRDEIEYLDERDDPFSEDHWIDDVLCGEREGPTVETLGKDIADYLSLYSGANPVAFCDVKYDADKGKCSIDIELRFKK